MKFELKPYAVRGDAGDPLVERRWPVPGSGSRSAFQRDRDRVVQARAFRRLAGKTQVFTTRSSDHFRSRLTHTIEVVQIAREVALTLGLNEDLAETLALVHDIGHPPFGHAGERALDECLRQHGLGFDHNLHALRTVEYFEQRYASHRGLNLTLGVREGIIKHSREYRVEKHPELAEYFLEQRPPLEAQLIDLVDEIAYLTADLDDGVESGLLDVRDICSHIGLMGESYARVEREHANVETKFKFNEALQWMQHSLTEDLLRHMREQIAELGIESLEDVRRQSFRIAAFSPEMEEARLQEKRYLYAALYGCDPLEEEHRKAEEVIKAVFAHWVRDPELLPLWHQKDIESEGVPRVVADYIAGMTDSFILEHYERL